MSIANRLKKLRTEWGLSQKDFAEKTGVPFNSYRDYEYGKSSPGSDALAGIAAAGADINWLLTGEAPSLSFGARVKKARHYFGYSPQRFCQLAGISEEDLQAYESNEKKPDMEIIEKISRFGIQLNWLLKGEEPISLYPQPRLNYPIELKDSQEIFNEIFDQLVQVEDKKQRRAIVKKIGDLVRDSARLHQLEKWYEESKSRAVKDQREPD